MKLSGDRNQCQGCKQPFNSSYAFDKHRVGEFGKDRRCLTQSEMLAKGMGTNTAGFWVSALMTDASNGYVPPAIVADEN